MALVAYDVSDASDLEDEGEETTSNVKLETVIVAKADRVAESNVDNFISDADIKDSNLCSALPTPKTKPVIFNSDLSQKLLLNKPVKTNSKKSVKIAVPSLSEFDEDLPRPTVKTITKPSKGSGLFALLPPPKNSATFAKEKRLVPDILRKPPPSKPVAKPIVKPLPKPVLAPLVEPMEDDDDDDSDGEDADFLGLKKRFEPEPVVPALPEVPEVQVSTPFIEESIPVDSEMNSSSFYPPKSDFLPLPSDDKIELDEEAMRALCGGNKRRRTNVQAQLIDVSEADVVPDKNEWMVKQLTEEKVKRQSHKKNAGPSSQQKRKHQITYLAFQAKEQEQELQNQWASNRQTKKQTQSKYGF